MTIETDTKMLLAYQETERVGARVEVTVHEFAVRFGMDEEKLRADIRRLRERVFEDGSASC
jgi:hypothetical protein